MTLHGTPAPLAEDVPDEYGEDRAAWWNGYGEGLAAAELTDAARAADAAEARTRLVVIVAEAAAIGAGWLLGSLYAESVRARRRVVLA